jgi:hypothetical protein
MKRYTVSQARERLSDVLDEVERSGAVMIERRAVRYVIKPAAGARGGRRRQPAIEVLDPAVERGVWRWKPSRGGIRFAAGRPARTGK